MADDTRSFDLKQKLRWCIGVQVERVKLAVMREGQSGQLSATVGREIRFLVELVEKGQAFEEAKQSLPAFAEEVGSDGLLPNKTAEETTPDPFNHLIDDLDTVDRNLMRAAGAKAIAITAEEAKGDDCTADKLEPEPGGAEPKENRTFPVPAGEDDTQST